MQYELLGGESIRYFNSQLTSGEGKDDAGRFLLVNGKKIRVSDEMYRTDPLAYERLKARYGLPADGLSYYEWLESKGRYQAGTYNIGGSGVQSGIVMTYSPAPVKQLPIDRTAAIATTQQQIAQVSQPEKSSNIIPMAIAGAAVAYFAMK